MAPSAFCPDIVGLPPFRCGSTLRRFSPYLPLSFMKTRPFHHFEIIAFLSTVSLAQAGQPQEPFKEMPPLGSPFDQGAKELQVVAGSYFSLNNGGGKRPTLNDADLNLRLGWMLNSPAGTGVFRGNCELLADFYGAAVWDGPGNGMIGLNALLRYNFVQPESKWVPYFQVGAGGLYNDIYKETPQRVIGQGFEFNLQAGLGVRIFLQPNFSVSLEGNFRHISNGDQADRNLGLNSMGGLVGVSYFF